MLPEDLNPEALEAYQFRFESPRIRLRPEFARYAQQSFTPGRPMVEALLDLTSRIHHDFRFDSKVTTVRTPIEEVFRKETWRLPGLCAHSNRLPSLHQPACKICQRLSAHLPASRSAAHGRRRRISCVGVRILSWNWLARRGSHQRCRSVNRPRHHWLGTRLRRCQSSARPHSRRRRPYAQSRCRPRSD